MTSFEKWTAAYRDRARNFEARPEDLQDLERSVMQRLDSPWSNPRRGPVLAFAGAMLILLVSVIAWPEQQESMLATASKPAEVESVFYLDGHVAIWLDTPESKGDQSGGDQQ